MLLVLLSHLCETFRQELNNIIVDLGLHPNITSSDQAQLFVQYPAKAFGFLPMNFSRRSIPF
jgi:hypothetical protein